MCICVCVYILQVAIEMVALKAKFWDPGKCLSHKEKMFYITELSLEA